MQRRELLKAGTAAGVLGLTGCASTAPAIPDKARVLVVGAGYGGATAAKYLRLWSNHTLDVVLVEPNDRFVSCPTSNLVLGGSKTLADITLPYTTLASVHGVTLVRDSVSAIDPAKKTATLASGATIRYDKLLLSPGIDLMWDSVA